MNVKEKKYLLRQTDDNSVEGPFETLETAKEQLRDNLDMYNEEANQYIIYEISAAFNYIPPTDTGTVVPTEIK